MFLRLLFLLLVLPVTPAAAYSVLTHQAVIDSTWEKCLVPLLHQHYPGATPEQMDEAKSYAYGGAIIQDMGYYPLGAEFFTDLTHYARSGDFVRNLLAAAHNRNEYAFALGALSHYVADNIGHPEGTNRIMPTIYPQLRAKYGDNIAYEKAPHRHTELEFSFDVVQVAAGRYRTQQYHKFIGFRVSKPVLERAFQQTYGLELSQVLFNIDVGVASFRFAVNQLLPAAARAAWHSQREKIRQVSPRARRREYMYKTNRRQFKRELGTEYEKPGFGARLMAKVINILPKIGPLKTYAFKLPSPEGEAVFRKSYRSVLSGYAALIRQQPTDTMATIPSIPNTSLDTGQPTQPSTYGLADETYAEWLRELHQRKFEGIPAAVRQHLLSYYKNGVPTHTPEEEDEDDRYETQKEHRETQEALQALQVAGK